VADEDSTEELRIEVLDCFRILGVTTLESAVDAAERHAVQVDEAHILGQVASAPRDLIALAMEPLNG